MWSRVRGSRHYQGFPVSTPIETIHWETQTFIYIIWKPRLAFCERSYVWYGCVWPLEVAKPLKLHLHIYIYVHIKNMCIYIYMYSLRELISDDTMVNNFPFFELGIDNFHYLAGCWEQCQNSLFRAGGYVAIRAIQPLQTLPSMYCPCTGHPKGSTNVPSCSDTCTSNKYSTAGCFFHYKY